MSSDEACIVVVGAVEIGGVPSARCRVADVRNLLGQALECGGLLRMIGMPVIRAADAGKGVTEAHLRMIAWDTGAAHERSSGAA